MNAQSKQKPLTVTEFLEWAGAYDGDGKFELHDGVIVPIRTSFIIGASTIAMAPERVRHGQAKLNIAIALKAAVKTAGLSCEAFVDSIGVAIDAFTTYIPGALVNCGERLLRDAMLATNPIIVVEVFSPSSASRDQLVKIRHYFTIPSIVHVLTVNGEAREIYHHTRGEGGAFVSRLAGETLRLDPPGMEIDLKEIFEDEHSH
ncbi:MAG: Uma2 family endonuclease [Hyphomicrobiales bacterium]|nr:Uma2 family endonuclease [Hyphomicrobiales bacterium]